MPTNHDRVGIVDDRLAGHHRKVVIVRLQVLDPGRSGTEDTNFDD